MTHAPPPLLWPCRAQAPQQSPPLASAPPAPHQSAGGPPGYGGGGGVGYGGAYGGAPPYAGQYAPPAAGYGLEHAVVTYPTLPTFAPPRAAPPGGNSAYGSAPQRPSPPPARAAEFAPEEPGGPEGSARFRVLLLPSEDGGDLAEVVAQVGLDGVRLLDAGRRTLLRVYPLERVTRWAVRDATVLAFWARPGPPPDDAEKCVQLSSDERTTRSLLDVLVCSCLQACELRGIDAGDMVDAMGSGAGSNKLAQAAAAAPLPPPATGRAAAARTADPGAASVEWWRAPEHAGWLLKKGEHLSTWRRRWFVLRDGRLAWFLTDKAVGPGAKPRGVLPLRACPGARAATLAEAGKPYALELAGPDANATGCRHLAADNEADKEKWVAALQRAAAAAVAAASPGAGALKSHDEWAARLREGIEAMSAAAPPPRAQPTIEVAGYGGGGGGYDDRGSAGSWQVHYNESGSAYYHNAQTGQTQWQPPPGFR